QFQTTPGEAAAVVANINAAQQRVPEVIRAARRNGALDVAESEKVLDDIEANLGLGEQPQVLLTVLGAIHAKAIWDGFCAQEWTESEKRAFADALLNRAVRF